MELTGIGPEFESPDTSIPLVFGFSLTQSPPMSKLSMSIVPAAIIEAMTSAGIARFMMCYLTVVIVRE